jgi:hypothetical protein
MLTYEWFNEGGGDKNQLDNIHIYISSAFDKAKNERLTRSCMNFQNRHDFRHDLMIWCTVKKKKE